MEPVIVQIRPGKALFLGVLSGFVGLMFFGLFMFLWIFGTTEQGMVFLGGLTGLAILGYAVHHLGIAIRKPVALRMDAHGISGYFAEPSVWPEIMEIETFSGSKGARYLGFAFLNPDIIRDRQSFARRLYNWSHRFTYNYQIVVPETLLRDADVDTLAAAARAFHRAA